MWRALHCTDWLPLGQSWDQWCGVRNHLSLRERGGTSSQRWAGQHHISLLVARGLFTLRRAVKPPGANALQSFESTCASERGLGDCAHARDVVLARVSMTCVARALFVFHIHAHTTHTPHNNTLSTQLFFHEISLKVAPEHPNYSDETAPPS